MRGASKLAVIDRRFDFTDGTGSESPADWGTSREEIANQWGASAGENGHRERSPKSRFLTSTTREFPSASNSLSMERLNEKKPATCWCPPPPGPQSRCWFVFITNLKRAIVLGRPTDFAIELTRRGFRHLVDRHDGGERRRKPHSLLHPTLNNAPCNRFPCGVTPPQRLVRVANRPKVDAMNWIVVTPSGANGRSFAVVCLLTSSPVRSGPDPLASVFDDSRESVKLLGNTVVPRLSSQTVAERGRIFRRNSRFGLVP